MRRVPYGTLIGWVNCLRFKLFVIFYIYEEGRDGIPLPSGKKRWRSMERHALSLGFASKLNCIQSVLSDIEMRLKVCHPPGRRK